MLFRVFVFLSPAVLTFGLPAYAATFIFNNQDRISGQIRAETAESYTVETAYGTLSIPRDGIQEIIFDEEDRVPPEAPAFNESPGLAIARLFPADWVYDGIINVGFSRDDGNSDQTRINTDSQLRVTFGKNRVRARAEFYYEEAEGNRVDDERNFELVYDRYLTERFFANTNARYQVNDAANLDLRQSYGLGFGYDWINTDLATFTTTAGVNTVREKFSDGTDNEYGSLRWEIDYTRKLLDRKAEFFHHNIGLVNIEDAEDIDITTKTGFRWTVYENWKLSTQVNFDWDNKPAPGAREEDIKYLLSLGYAFSNTP